MTKPMLDARAGNADEARERVRDHIRILDKSLNGLWNLGRNVVVASGVVVCAHCQIGDSVILNTGCIVDHQTMIGEGSHIYPGVRIAGRVKVESGAFVGIGATIIPKVTIGCESIVGAGAVVIEDVPSLATVVGVPARAITLATASEDAAAMLLPNAPSPASPSRFVASGSN